MTPPTDDRPSFAPSQHASPRRAPETPVTFIPVTTLRYPLDVLLRPYLERLCEGVLISVPELRRGHLEGLPRLPLWVDSGGFAAFDPRARVAEVDGMGILILPDGTRLTPQDVFREQQQVKAAVRFTLDFPAPDTLPDEEREKRARLSQANAIWALEQPRSGKLYACLQRGASPVPLLPYAPYGIALGGCVPLSRDRTALSAEIRRVRAQMPPEMPLHVFGLGHPDSIRAARLAGAQSVDSSSPQQTAASGRTWAGDLIDDPSPAERLNLALKNLQAALDAGTA